MFSILRILPLKQILPKIETRINFLIKRKITVGKNSIKKIRSRHYIDGVSKEIPIIYESSSRHYYITGYISLGLISVTLIFASKKLLSVSLKDINEKEHLPISMGSQTETTIFVASGIALCLFLFFGAYKSYNVAILRIYLNENNGQLIAIKRNALLQIRKIKFKPEDVALKETGPFFSAFTGNITIKGTPFCIEKKDFITSRSFNKMFSHAYGLSDIQD